MAAIAFTDLTALRRLDRTSAATLPAVARQFEAMFVDLMLQAAHEATRVLAAGNPFQSNETDLHEEMLNHQLALDMAEHGGIGLAPLLMRQLGAGVAHSTATATATATARERATATATADGAPLARDGFMAATGTAVRAGKALHAAAAPLALPGATHPAFVIPRTANDGLPLAPATRPALQLPAAVRARLAPAAAPAPAGGGGAAAANGAGTASAWGSPVEFVRAVLPVIEKVTRGTPISPLAVLAQAALETGWGKSVIGAGQGRSSFNLFGVKADAQWRGAATVVSTLEFIGGVPQLQRAVFRTYDDVEHAVQDFVQKLQGSARYADALSAAGEPKAYAREIGRAGYATDPQYAQKLSRVLDSATLSGALAQVRVERAAAARGRSNTSIEAQ